MRLREERRSDSRHALRAPGDYERHGTASATALTMAEVQLKARPLERESEDASTRPASRARDTGRYGEIWGDDGRYPASRARETGGDMGRYGEIRGDDGRDPASRAAEPRARRRSCALRRRTSTRQSGPCAPAEMSRDELRHRREAPRGGREAAERRPRGAEVRRGEPRGAEMSRGEPK